MAALLLKNRALARTPGGRFLVTTAGGAPCCCGGGPGACIPPQGITCGCSGGCLETYPGSSPTVALRRWTNGIPTFDYAYFGEGIPPPLTRCCIGQTRWTLSATLRELDYRRTPNGTYCLAARVTST